MTRRIALFVLLLALFAGVSVAFRYSHWHEQAVETLERGAEVIETRLGPIEVARFGDAGPAILLLHGTPGGYDQAGGLGKWANGANVRLLAVSRPGYLRTPIDVGRTPAEQADAYAALLDAVDVDRAAVIGISGGGPSALEFAIRHPDRCWALVDLMGVSRAYLPGEIEDDTFADIENSIFAFLFDTDFGGWMLGGLLQRDPERMLETLVPDPRNRDRILADPTKLEGFIELTRSAIILPERRNAGTTNDLAQFEALEVPELERISAPTLVLHGTADINVPLAMGKLVAQRVPGAKLITFPDADHFMVLSHADEVFGALFDFLIAVLGSTSVSSDGGESRGA